MPKPNDPCGNCNHAFEFHATDVSTDKLRCWHGSVRQDADGKYISASYPGVYKYYDPFEPANTAAAIAAAANEGRRLKG